MTTISVPVELLERVLYIFDNYVTFVNAEEDELRALLAQPAAQPAAQVTEEVRVLREALEFACKSLAQVTSSDGSGHADIALAVLRMAGVGADEREKMVEGWKSKCQWNIDAALAAHKTGEEE